MLIDPLRSIRAVRIYTGDLERPLVMVSERKKTATFPESEIALPKFSRVRRGGLASGSIFQSPFSPAISIDERKGGGGEGRGPTARPKRDPGDPRLRERGSLVSAVARSSRKTAGREERRRRGRDEGKSREQRRQGGGGTRGAKPDGTPGISR